jgi:hypothetical protein
MLTACITHHPVRTFDEVSHDAPAASCPATPSPSETTSIAQLRDPRGDAHRTLVGCTSEERHAPSTSGAYPHRGFNLHVFEFDDDGVPWNAAQQRQSLDALRKELDAGPAVVVTFVHGWKNDASVCNGNISCFRDVLEILAKGESSFAGPTGTPRNVVGVYIGWRGGTVGVKGLEQITFWGRKHTAHVIGDNGGVTAVIERLRAIVDESKNRQRAMGEPGIGEDTSLVLVGHSFGGALLFSALATSLNAKVGEAIQRVHPSNGASQPSQVADYRSRPVMAPGRVCVPSGGDLVVLINPAMEASRFANLAAVRNLAFAREQVPMFMTLASEADWAVGGFFPVGNAFSTLARSARSRDAWLRMDKGFGLYEPYHTHRIVAGPAGKLPPGDSVSGVCACKSNLGAAGDDIIRGLQPLYEQLRRIKADDSGASADRAFDALRLAGYQEMLASRLEPIRDVDPNNPFVMATVDPAVVNGHSDIFNPRFMDFLIEYVIRSEVKRDLIRTLGTGCPR